jgi:hypothetical protein
MNIFPEQPEVSKADALRIHPHLSNRNVVRKWIRTNPELEDLKRAVLIEVFRCVQSRRAPLTTMNRGVYADLMAAIMKRERSSIDEAVMDTINEAHEKWKGIEIQKTPQ